MSPYPLDSPRAAGPMRLVLTTYPSREAALRAVDSALRAGLATCANVLPAYSRYWWKGQLESADEALVSCSRRPRRRLARSSGTSRRPTRTTSPRSPRST